MEVTVSGSGGVYLEVIGANNDVLLAGSAGQTYFAGNLPLTQDYYINIYSPFSSHSYGLNVTIPVRIAFDPGETSATIPGHVSESQSVDFILYAFAGQQMSLEVTGASTQVALSVLGLSDGQPYLRHVAEETSWTMTLPNTQEYLIGVRTISPATDFILYVEITG